MKSITGKFWTRIIVLILIILIIAAFGDMWKDSGSSASIALNSLMSTLPFSKQIVDIVTKVLKYQETFPIVTTATVFNDALKLLIMAFLQPTLTVFLSMLLIKVPYDFRYDGAEKYMKTPGYMIKEMIIKVLSTPILALFAAYITDRLFVFAVASFGPVGSFFTSVLVTLAAFGISLLPLLITHVAIGTLIAWRISVTVLGKVVTTLGTEVLCVIMALSIINKSDDGIVGSAIGLLVWLFAMDLGIQMIQHAIVGNSVSR